MAAKPICTYCQGEIIGVHILCAECEDFTLCPQCFAWGVEIGKHKNDHQYQFEGAENVPLTESGWTSREQVHLLDAVEQFGYGSWEDIGRHLETRTPEQAKEEYNSLYLTGVIGLQTWGGTKKPKLRDYSVDDKGPLGPEAFDKIPPIDCTPDEAKQLGYMPNRDMFERESDPTAEQVISGMSMGRNDSDIGIALKLSQVDVYTRRLRERQRRKRIVRDYQLLRRFFRGAEAATPLRVRTLKEQREFNDRFRIFAQFYSYAEFERRLDNFAREKLLHIRLSELSRYRWNGLQRFDECIHFEQHVASQNRDTGPYGQFGRTAKRRAGVRHPSSTHSEMPVDNENEETESSSSIDQKCMLPIVDQASSDVSSPSKDCLDNNQNAVQRDPRYEPGGSMLNANEITICVDYDIAPSRYLQIKMVFLSRKSADGLMLTPGERIVFEYLKEVGWLRRSKKKYQKMVY